MKNKKYFNLTNEQREINNDNPRRFVLTYDIVSNKNRTKVAKIIESYDGTRIQKSVFEFYTRINTMKTLVYELDRFLSLDDKLIYYEVKEVNSYRYGVPEFKDSYERIVFV
jgi:CRISPR-associated endonuclease Cas2